MGYRARLVGLREPWRLGHVLLVIPVVLIAVITAVDILLPEDIHLGPLLVIAPAITASFEGPLLTGAIGLLAMAAQVYIALHSDVLSSRNALVQIAALAILSALVVCFCLIRERHTRQLAQVRSVAEATQNVLLRPLPERIGPLRIASLYLAAEDEAQIGGDLYAAARIDNGTRVMIGDVRGKGLAAIDEAALLLSAFRQAAHRHTDLPDLAAVLNQNVALYHADYEPEHDDEAGERFITALLLEIPDEGRTSRMISCGHPAPLLLSPGHAVTAPILHPAPPMGIDVMRRACYIADVFAFEAGDTLFLFTDGVIEARDQHGGFYPLAERAAQWTESSPDALLHHLRRDLLDYAGGRLGDDAALIAIHHNPAHATSLQHAHP
ncbi:PP2C family protein-serine/threonine phosphatase [Streptomyces sp. NPDC058231]|uniref:PP2C family protein-serine/threonine phosphatase n=1 Tax=Streptomyces sp. NPDC058231 TaxID=3346392 RepID=UPI0036E2F9A9